MEIKASDEYKNHIESLSIRLKLLEDRPSKTFFKDIFHRLRFNEYENMGNNIIELKEIPSDKPKHLNFESQELDTNM